MSIDYDELIRRVPKWLYASNRSLTDEMPVIVQQAHDQLLNVMDHDLFRTLIEGKSVDPQGSGVLDLSAESPRILEIRGIRLRYRDGSDDWTPIQRRDLEMLSALYARNRPKRPLYYAEYSGPLIVKLFPSPREAYDLQITANVEPLVLTPSNQTNIISEQFPRALEKAAMRQACLYQKNWEDAAAYETEMMAAVTEANAQVQRRRRDETGTRPMAAENVSGV